MIKSTRDKCIATFGLIAIALFSLAACNSGTAVQTTQVAADAAAVVADMVAAEQQIQASCTPMTAACTVSPVALADINAAITVVNGDLAALNSGSTSTEVQKVLADVDTALATLAPYAPAIEALIGTLATPAHVGAAHMAMVASATQASITADYGKLKSDTH